jgi:aminoglycoside phosphotransferase (APT) family kinase protein
MTVGGSGQNDGHEMPLFGGSVSGATRVGDTVRRSTGPWSEAVQELLRYLERVDFAGAPRFLGIDEHDREILSWIDGVAATRPWPAELLTDDGLAALTALLLRYHGAVADLSPSMDSRWATGHAAPKMGEIICHGDPGPWNSIWRDGTPVAFVDFDSAHPAPALHDVGYLAWNAVPFRPDDLAYEAGFAAPPDRMRRLSVIVDTYGLAPDVDLLDVVDEVMRLDAERIQAHGAEGLEPWKTFLALGQDGRTAADRRWLASFRQFVLPA